MIRVRMEMLPGGQDLGPDNKLLGEILISNDVRTSLENPRRGTYNCVIYKKRRMPWRTLRIQNFPRASYHPWNLVYEILKKAREQSGII